MYLLQTIVYRIIAHLVHYIAYFATAKQNHFIVGFGLYRGLDENEIYI